MAVYSNWFFDYEGERQDDTPLDELAYSQYTQSDITELGMKYYFLPMLKNCYEFTKRQGLDRFCLKTSPTFIFYHDRLIDQRPRWMIQDIFFESLRRVGVLNEEILLLYDKVLPLNEDKSYPPYGINKQKERIILNTSTDYTSFEDAKKIIDNLSERYKDTELGIVVSSGNLNITKKIDPPITELNEHTNYLAEDIRLLTQCLDKEANFLSDMYSLKDEEFRKLEIRDLSYLPEDRQKKYKMREFRYKVFTPRHEEK